jgi:hypothetical protein
MSKPLGLAFGMDANGPTIYVNRPNAAQDAIWNAVQMAFCYGMTAEQFMREVREAWEQEADDAKADALLVFEGEK